MTHTGTVTHGMLLVLLTAGLLPAQQAEPRLVVQVGHTRPVRAIDLSSDGHRVVTGSDDQTARLWDARTGHELLSMGAGGPVAAVSFGPGDSTIIVVSRDTMTRVRVWSLATATVVDSMFVAKHPLVAVSPRGQVAVAEQHRITIWNPRTANRTSSVDIVEGPATAMRWAPAGDALVVSDSTGGVAMVQMVRATSTPVSVVRGVAHQIAVSESGLFALAGVDDAIQVGRLQPAADTQRIRLSGHNGPITGIAFAGPRVVSISLDGTVRAWNLPRGDDQLVGPPALRGATPTAVASREGTLAVGYADGRVGVFDAHRLSTRHVTGGNRSVIRVAVTGDGASSVTVSSDQTMHLWDNGAGHVVRTIRGHPGAITSIAFAPNDSTIVTGGADGALRLWDVHSGRQQRVLRRHAGRVVDLALSPDGSRIASVGEDRQVRLWSARTGLLERVLPHPSQPQAVVFLDSGTVAIAGADGVIRGIQLSDGASPFPEVVVSPGRGLRALAVNRDRSRLTAVTLRGDVALYRITSAQAPSEIGRLKPVDLGGLLVQGVVFAGSRADERIAIAAGPELLLWNPDAPVPLERVVGHSGELRGIARADDRFIVTVGSDGTTRFWSATHKAPPEGRLLMTRAVFDSVSWVSAHPDGRFEGSEEGIRRLHYVEGLRTVSLESLIERFYTPGLSATLFLEPSGPDGGAGSGFRDDVRRGLEATPLVEIVAPIAGTTDRSKVLVAIAATERGGAGVGEVRLYHNGARISHATRGLGGAASERTESCPPDTVCFELDLLFGANVIEASALNRQGTESRRARTIVVGRGARPSARLFVLSVGINEYDNTAYKLTWARADAHAVVESLRAGGRGLFADVVIADTLFDAAATRENILRAFARVAAQSEPEDVFVFYFAGHGIVPAVGGDSARFHLIPHDVQSMSDAASLAATGIDADRLRALFEAVPARRRLLVLDACQSGAATEAFGMQGAAELRALARLGRSSGIFVLTSTDSEQRAAEAAALGHGVFTHAFLTALSGDTGEAPRARMVGEVVAHARRIAPEVSLRFTRRAQFPLVWSNGIDFPLVVR